MEGKFQEANSFYLSRVLGNKIYDSENNVIGSLKDLGIINQLKNPKVEAVKVKMHEGIKFLNWDNFIVTKQKGQYVLTCNKIEEKCIDDIMFLAKHVLDKQIVDINGRKVVRVNDIRLSAVNSGIYVIAVDIGWEGLLRRIGIAKPIRKINPNITNSMILWADVASLINGNDSIQLSKTYHRLSVMHPSDLADIIEDFDTKTGLSILENLDNAKAADVIEELEEDAQVTVIENLSTDRAADILEEMPADEVADILDSLSEDKAEELLSNMEKEASEEVRDLMEYEDDVVGSLMSTDFVAFNNKFTVDQTINSLRNTKPEEDQMYYIYVVNNKNQLIGTISLRDIVVSQPDSTLESIMNKNFICMKDMDDINDLIKNISKYNLVAIPVVDEKMELIGNVVINDIIYELLKSKRRIG